MGGPARARGETRSTPGRATRAAWWTRAGTLAALLALALAGSRARVETSVDLYQFWAVPAARALAAGQGRTLPPVWIDPDATRRILDAHFAAEPDPGARRVHGVRRARFEPFGSPLLYAAFASLPERYSAAAHVFRGVQLLAFAAAVFGWVRLCGGSAALAAWAVAALALAWRPFGDDLFTGNVNALQLAGLAAATAPALRVRRGAGTGWAALSGALLAALALFKVNLLPAVAGVGLALGLRADGRGRRAAGGAALASGALGVVASSAYFASARAWPAWLAFAFGDPRRLGDYAVAQGNVSTARLLAEALGVDPLLATAVVAALLAASLVAVAHARARARGEGPLRALGALLAEPRRAAGFGAVAVLALPPLVWFHYFVVALAAVAWLVVPAHDRTVRGLGVASLVVLSAAYLPLVARAGLYPLLPPLWCLAWTLPWAGLCLEAARASDAPVAPSPRRQASSRR